MAGVTREIGLRVEDEYTTADAVKCALCKRRRRRHHIVNAGLMSRARWFAFVCDDCAANEDRGEFEAVLEARGFCATHGRDALINVIRNVEGLKCLS